MRITQQRMAEIMNKGRLGWSQTSKRVDLALSLLILANLIAVCLGVRRQYRGRLWSATICFRDDLGNHFRG